MEYEIWATFESHGKPVAEIGPEFVSSLSAAKEVVEEFHFTTITKHRRGKTTWIFKDRKGQDDLREFDYTLRDGHSELD